MGRRTTGQLGRGWSIASQRMMRRPAIAWLAVRLIHGDGNGLRQLAFTPDGAAVAAAGKNGVIRLWDPVTGQELLSLAAHRAQINGLGFSPDGSTLASVAPDGSVRLWRAPP